MKIQWPESLINTVLVVLFVATLLVAWQIFRWFALDLLFLTTPTAYWLRLALFSLFIPPFAFGVFVLFRLKNTGTLLSKVLMIPVIYLLLNSLLILAPMFYSYAFRPSPFKTGPLTQEECKEYNIDCPLPRPSH